jgi:flagellum-specific peptidoglycan hydrolase FlgJ
MYGIATYNATKKFIQEYGKGIANAVKGTGIFFPVAIGQKAWESGYGKKIPPNSNNFGGIKYNPNLKGVVGYVIADTTEYIKGKKVNMKQKFSKFASVEDGIAGYVNVLKAPRYAKALQAKTPYEQLFEIAKANYSTNNPKTYADLIYPLVEAARDISQIGKVV